MKHKNERGAVMIEATWCLLLVVFVAMFMISFGAYLYQRATFHVAANQIAEEAALTYKLKTLEADSFLSGSAVGSVGKYRFFLFENGFKEAKEAQAEEWIAERMDKTTFALEKGNYNVKIKKVEDDVGRYHLEVTVSQQYEYMLGDFLKFVGRSKQETQKVTVYVAGTDILYYANSIHMRQSLSELLGDADIIGTINNCISMLKNIGSLTK